MLFNSFEFAIFLPVVFILYWFVFNKSLKLQNFFLLLVSYIFYGWWDWRFLSLIAFSSVVDYLVGNRIYNSEYKKVRKSFLMLSLFVNLGLLGVFKYYNFFIDSWVNAFKTIGYDVSSPTLNIILPVGISFYTFQTLSYSLDIYYRKLKPSKDIVSFFAFVSFFPQLVAGPIERASNLLPQFYKKRSFDFDNAINGVKLILYGLFKKVVVADRLAIYVNSVYADIEGASTISMAIAVLFFSFQIYTDFSGYTDIARGVSKLLGFELMLNFNRPYLATSIVDFWRRWHISLSTWFKDYLYIPLGGSRKDEKRTYYNIMLVFLVSGFWHGANWTFIIWGAFHGLSQVVYLLKKRFFSSSFLSLFNIRILKIISVFTFVSLAWIFFRAETFNQSLEIFNKLLSFDFNLNLVQISAEKGPLNLLISFIGIGLLLISYLLPLDLKYKGFYKNLITTIVLVMIIITLGVNGKNDFIYFQF